MSTPIEKTELYDALRAQGMHEAEAYNAILDARRAVLHEGADPEEILYDFGLEPDFVFDLI